MSAVSAVRGPSGLEYAVDVRSAEGRSAVSRCKATGGDLRSWHFFIRCIDIPTGTASALESQRPVCIVFAHFRCEKLNQRVAYSMLLVKTV